MRAIPAQRGQYGVVAFDVDGTLINSADGKVVWQLLNRQFGSDPAVDAERFQAYLQREITYAEWVDLDIGHWQQASATREQIATVILEHLRLVPGARETMEALQDRGYRLAVISGTLDITLELLFPEHPFEQVFTNRVWFDEKGHIAGWRATPFDNEGKVQALEEIARRMGLSLSQTVYVGDNFNDVLVMQAAGFPIAFEPKSQQVADAARAVVTEDLRGVLSLLDGVG